MAYISCLGRLTVMLTGAATGQKGSESAGSRERLLDADTGSLADWSLSLGVTSGHSRPSQPLLSF